MTDTEAQKHLTEHPDHKLYDVRSDLARQYGCASIEEFELLNQSLVASGVNEIPEPPAEYFENHE